MATPSSSDSSSTIANPLSSYTVQDWKRICINKALELCAYSLLTGDEPTPAQNADIRVRHSYAERLSKIAGYI